MTELTQGLRSHAASSNSPPAPREETSPNAPTAPTTQSAISDDTGDRFVRRNPLFASPGESYLNTSDEDDCAESDASDAVAPHDATMDVSVANASELLKDHVPDFSGELQRKVSAMQAISNRAFTTWRTEWCVVSHNFLILFASRSDWTVRKCVLLSAIQGVYLKTRGGLQNGVRTFKILLESRSSSGKPEKISLRTPKISSAEESSGVTTRAQRWVDEINSRVELAVKSGGRLVPCLPFVDACQLVQRFQTEMDQAQKNVVGEALQRNRLARTEVVHRTLCGVITAKLRFRLRGAFEELVLHAQLQKWKGLRRMGAVRRLVSALEKPRHRCYRSMFLHWADLGSNQMKIASDIFVAEKKRAREKSIRLGALILTGLLRDWQAAEKDEHCRWAFLQLARLVQSTKVSVPLDGGWTLEKSSAVVSVSQRFHVAARLLWVAMRHLQASHCEGALRTWSIMAARCQQAEARELIRATSALNQQLMDRCKKVPLESRLRGMVLSIRASQHRRLLFAFVSWASMPCAPLAKSPMEEMAMPKSIDAWEYNNLRCAMDSSPPPPPLGVGDGPVNFSPSVRHVNAS